VRRCSVRAIYLSASAMAGKPNRGAITSVRPLPLPFNRRVPTLDEPLVQGLMTSASRGPSATAELLVYIMDLMAACRYLISLTAASARLTLLGARAAGDGACDGVSISDARTRAQLGNDTSHILPPPPWLSGTLARRALVLALYRLRSGCTNLS